MSFPQYIPSHRHFNSLHLKFCFEHIYFWSALSENIQLILNLLAILLSFQNFLCIFCLVYIVMFTIAVWVTRTAWWTFSDICLFHERFRIESHSHFILVVETYATIQDLVVPNKH